MRGALILVPAAALLLALWMFAGPAPTAELSGRVIGPPDGAMRVGLEVLVGGRVMPTVRHEGKTYLPVPRLGLEYTLRVWNHGPRRVAAVLSVDGLSVITGRPASEDGPGYIVDARRGVEIKGWRRSLNTVAAFQFVGRDESYAERVGRPENVGVIGLVAFEERVRYPDLRLERKDASPPGHRRAAEAMVGDTGTGWGRDVESRVITVPFARSGNRQAITLHYDTVAALRRAGVPVGRPVPFPEDGEFAPPPPPRRGR